MRRHVVVIVTLLGAFVLAVTVASAQSDWHAARARRASLPAPDRESTR